MGSGSGETRAADAARMAVTSPLLDVAIDGAKGILFNITGGEDLTLFEVNEAAEIITKAADQEANIMVGAVIDPRMQDEVRITVIATGFDTGRPASGLPRFVPREFPSREPRELPSSGLREPSPREPQPREPYEPRAPRAPQQDDRTGQTDNLDIPPFLDPNRRRFR